MLRTSREGSCEENIFLHACQKVGLPHSGLLWYFVVWSSSLFLTPVCVGGLFQKIQVLLDLLPSVTKIVHCAGTEKSDREMGFAAGGGACSMFCLPSPTLPLANSCHSLCRWASRICFQGIYTVEFLASLLEVWSDNHRLDKKSSALRAHSSL